MAGSSQSDDEPIDCLGDVFAAAGIAWWNALTEKQRAAALAAAETAVPAEAYRHHLAHKG